MKIIIIPTIIGATVGAAVLFLITLVGDPRVNFQLGVSSSIKELVTWFGILVGIGCGSVVGAICGLATILLGSRTSEPKAGS